MRVVVAFCAVGFVVACAPPPVPDSGAGVGFADYSDFSQERARRDALLAGNEPIITGGEISDEVVVSGTPIPTQSGPQTAGVVDVNNPGISDEQDFSAVASRESIESDRERLAAQRQAYQVIQPTALPGRPNNNEPSIVEYALSTTNSVGQPIYKRSVILAQSRFERNCAKYASSDQAQIAFLKAGGPQKDKLGLDPDGDGFACYWDPAPFRLAVRSQ